MYDALLMCRFEGFGDLFRDGQGLIDRDRPLGDAIRQGRPLNQLKDERKAAFDSVFFDSVDGRDIRVVETGQHLRFALEPGDPIRIGGEGVGQDLQSDIAAELGVGGAIDLAHPALPDEGGDFVVPDAVADVESHLSWRPKARGRRG